MKSSIILVDDDRDFLDILKSRLNRLGFKNIHAENDPLKASAVFEAGGIFDIALIDMTMPGMNGMELLDVIKNNSPRTECLMVTAVNEARVAVECLRKGAYDYLVKPISEEDLALSVHRTLERKRLLDILDIEKSNIPPEGIHKAFNSIVTRSQSMLKILKEAELHAGSDVPVLITGESGAGKELLARAIHDVSPRAALPFTPVNMASLTASLFEAEFFGHTKGAFTGAESGRAGYLEHTDGGTLFLDEIGDMPIELQGKLMRVLQNGEYLKLGSSAQHRADIRFIAATNEDLDRLMSRRMFRKDLYYRIRGGRLHLPPLRSRREDIPLLINTFIEKYCAKGKQMRIDDDALSALMNYDYPGNIRELGTIIQTAVNLAQGKAIALRFLPEHIRKMQPNPPRPLLQKKGCRKCEQTVQDYTGLYRIVQDYADEAVLPLTEIEKNYILDIYNRSEKNKSRTARILGIGLNTLRRKLKSYGED